jgi:two-component system cell cycle sensor histidine kinase PleC
LALDRTHKTATAAETARLDLITETLPVGRAQVPVWTVVILGAASGAFPTLAVGIDARLIAWTCLQVVVAATFHLVARLWPRGIDTGPFGITRRDAYVATYLLAGTAWGLLPWAMLQPGNVPSQAFVGIMLIAVSAVYSVRVSTHPATYLASVGSLGLVSIPSFFFGETDMSLALSIGAPLWYAFLIVTGLNLSRRIGEMIFTQIDNGLLAESYAVARDQARAASRAKSAFLANMSHELRTPLNAIIGFSDVMKSTLFGPLDARYQEYAADINDSGSHLLALVNDLLDLARIEAGKMQIEAQPFDVIEALRQVRRMLEADAEAKRQTITLTLDPQLEEIEADSRAFRKIVANLASNAVKFTQAGGLIEIGLRRDGEDAVLWVSDNGPGIPAEKLETIFRSFERVDDSYSVAASGSGLGLALVQAFAGLHGGSTMLESVEGRGTTVTVRLPNAVPTGLIPAERAA